jgi:hypothetical protein
VANGVAAAGSIAVVGTLDGTLVGVNGVVQQVVTQLVLECGAQGSDAGGQV